MIFASMWWSILICQVFNLENKFLNWCSRKFTVLWCVYIYFDIATLNYIVHRDSIPIGPVVTMKGTTRVCVAKVLQSQQSYVLYQCLTATETHIKCQSLSFNTSTILKISWGKLCNFAQETWSCLCVSINVSKTGVMKQQLVFHLCPSLHFNEAEEAAPFWFLM